jgi:NAD(P)-dependent dehydrogenase (short-subunit alcohol dehydrogenase family)
VESANISGSVHLLFGGAGGIGSATARLLVAQGARVVVAGRSAERLATAAAELGVETVVCDATDFGAVEQVVNEVAQRHGRLDGVANLVGSILLKPAARTSESEWRATIAANLDTAFAVVRAASAVMNASGGAIVLMSSAAARVGLANHDAIAAAKAGVIGLALSAAANGAPRGVRVNVVAPGLVETPLASGIVANEAARKASTAMHPLGRIGRADDVARAIAWLLDPAQSWVTGQVLGVDGGLATVRGR